MGQPAADSSCLVVDPSPGQRGPLSASLHRFRCGPRRRSLACLRLSVRGPWPRPCVLAGAGRAEGSRGGAALEPSCRWDLSSF